MEQAHGGAEFSKLSINRKIAAIDKEIIGLERKKIIPGLKKFASSLHKVVDVFRESYEGH